MRGSWTLAVLLIAVVACSDGQAATEWTGRPVTGVVDSVLPSDVSLSRFLEGLDRPAGLSGGAGTTSALIGKFLDASARGDTAALNGLLVSRAEYGFFYYPTSVYSRKPYELSPDVAWLLSSQENAKAVTRLAQRLSGRRLSVSALDCGRTQREGANVVHSECSVSVVEGGRSSSTRLFRSVLERNGHFKFLSYAGDL